jgi:DUF1680 family protein
MVHCCCGVRTRLYGLLPELLYSVTDDDDVIDGSPCLYVDLYNSSEFIWERKQGNVTVKTLTMMPYDEKIHIDIEGSGDQNFTVKLRIPKWAKGPVLVTVDGNRIVTGQEESYLAIEGNWSGSHSIDFSLPFGWKLTKYRGAEEHYDNRTEPPLACDRWAYEYGPLLMAISGTPEGREYDCNKDIRYFLDLDPKEYASWMEKTGEPLHFNVKGYPFKVVPYFELGSDEPFSCYPHFYPEGHRNMNERQQNENICR